jgi:UDP-N-acetylglucosamine 2-epimerase (non-hydrolysing)
MVNRKRIMYVFGTRPEAIKMAPVINEAERYPDIIDPVIVVTGQHRQMLDQVLRIFEIDTDYDLGVMEQDQTIINVVTKSLSGLEQIILREKPDMLLVQGDTSTAFAAGMAAFYYKIPLGHVEAGLRTFDKWRPYPEEINRKLITAVADLHFAPTGTALQHLLEEKVPRDHIYLTGNTVIDSLLKVAKKDYDLSRAGIKLNKDRRMILVTAHRRENFGAPLKNICEAIRRLADKYRSQIDFIIPVHKNPRVKHAVEEMLAGIDNVNLIEPLDYEPFVHLMKNSYFILTDSGGVQEEAPSLGKPVLVLREKTERPEALSAGSVKLVGMEEASIFNAAEKLINDPAEYNRMSQAVNPYGDGHAAQRIISSILHYFGALDRRPEEFSA